MDIEADEGSEDYRVHKEYAARTGFCIGRNLDREWFSEREVAILDRYGYWMQALSNKEIPAISKAQRRFLDAVSLNVPPQPPFETVWLRFLRHEERRNQAKKKALEKVERDAQRRAKAEQQFEKSKEQLVRAANEMPAPRTGRGYGKLAPYKSPDKSSNSTGCSSQQESRLGWKPCVQCGGDGGAGGRCPRCGGNGFEPKSG